MHLLFVENATSEGKKAGGQREVHDEAKDEPNNENPSSHFLHELDENDSQMEQFDTMHANFRDPLMNTLSITTAAVS